MFFPLSELLNVFLMSIFLISVISQRFGRVATRSSHSTLHAWGQKWLHVVKRKVKTLKHSFLRYDILSCFSAFVITPARILLGFSLSIPNGTVAITSLLPLPTFCIPTWFLTALKLCHPRSQFPSRGNLLNQMSPIASPVLLKVCGLPVCNSSHFDFSFHCLRFFFF